MILMEDISEVPEDQLLIEKPEGLEAELEELRKKLTMLKIK